MIQNTRRNTKKAKMCTKRMMPSASGRCCAKNCPQGQHLLQYRAYHSQAYDIEPDCQCNEAVHEQGRLPKSRNVGFWMHEKHHGLDHAPKLYTA